MSGKGIATSLTEDAGIPWAASADWTSRVPMLSRMFDPIVFPRRPASDATGEPAGTRICWEPGRETAPSARMRHETAPADSAWAET